MCMHAHVYREECGGWSVGRLNIYCSVQNMIENERGMSEQQTLSRTVPGSGMYGQPVPRAFISIKWSTNKFEDH